MKRYESGYVEFVNLNRIGAFEKLKRQTTSVSGCYNSNTWGQMAWE
jgi:hypothetical protein